MSAQDTSPAVPLNLSARAALAAIRFYQRRLSPLKGFRCAHSVLHGGPGCSGYAAEAIRTHGLLGAIQPIRQRFRDCRAAFVALGIENEGKGDLDRNVNKSLIAKKSSDSPCADAKCSPCTNRRHAACWIGGEGGATACSACDLSAAKGGAACGGASAGAEAAGGVCSAVSCCN